MDEHEETLPSKYPKQVFFLYFSNTFERHAYYGILTILTTFFTQYLEIKAVVAKMIYHFFLMITAFLPLYGAILADVYVGKYVTTFINTIIYCIGGIFLTIAATPALYYSSITFTMVGLIFLGLGKAGMKTPSYALGGDQFRLPEQRKQLLGFFSWMYLITNVAATFSMFMSPFIRSKPCLGEDSCYTLAFGMQAILLIIAFMIFTSGKKFYVIKIPKGNLMVDVTKCIVHAIKMRKRATERRAHWLDYSEEKYGARFIYDVKTALRVLLLFVPIPLFWALYDQQGSAWIFMARNMNGNIGFYTILPEHTLIINPILVVIFIPIFDYGIYPMCLKLHVIRKPLQRMVTGAFLAVISTFIAAVICLQIEKNLPNLATNGHAHLFFYNNNVCPAYINAHLDENTTTSLQIDPMGHVLYKMKVKEFTQIDFNVTGTCINAEPMQTMEIEEKGNYGIHITNDYIMKYAEDNNRDENSLPKVRVLVSGPKAENIRFKLLLEGTTVYEVGAMQDFIDYLPRADVFVLQSDDGTFEQEVDLMMGGVYVILVHRQSANDMRVSTIEITKHNEIHMAWILPQYVVLTAAEIMFSVTGTQFCYAEAPKTMNTFLQAAFVLTISFGNLFVIIIESLRVFDKLSYNFFMYGGFMLFDVVLLAYLCYGYVYYTGHDKEEGDEET